MKNRLFLSALSLLGFSGCSEQGIELFDEPDMYGVPIVDYTFMGEVTDADGNPIKGIEVKISSSDDVVSTDDQGVFKADFTSDADGYHTVEFSDVDGVENGGEFAQKSVELEWKDAESIDGRDLFDVGTVKLDAKEE